MRAYDAEMTPRPRWASPVQERISPLDLYWFSCLVGILQGEAEWRTYAFNIASDTLPDREETQS